MQNETRTLSLPKQNPFCNVEKVATWCRLTQPYVRQLVDAGIIKSAKNDDGDIIKGKFKLFEAVGDYISFLHLKRKEKPVSQTEMDLARIENIKSKTQREVMTNLLMQGTIVRIEDVDACVIDMILALKSKLLGFGAHTASLVVGKEDTAEISRILTEQMEKTLIDLKPIDRDEIRSRNRKLKGFTDIMQAFDENGD
jgi:hypothetical protein